MNKVALVVAVMQVLLLLTSATSSQSIDKRDVAIIDGRRYYFSPIEGNIPGAISVCTDVNMTLAAFETVEEYDAVINYMANNLSETYNDGYWTSGTRQYNIWVWSSIGREITYFKWWPGQPDITDFKTQTHICVTNGFMADWEPYNYAKFICEQI